MATSTSSCSSHIATGQIRAVERVRLCITCTSRELIAQKQRLGHGNFLPWIEAELSLSYPTANRFMTAAETFKGKSLTVRDLPATILYALAAPSTPEPIREGFMQEAEEQGGASPACGVIV